MKDGQLGLRNKPAGHFTPFFAKIHRLNCEIFCGTIVHIKKRGIKKLELYPFLKSLVDMDQCAVVLCNLRHEIIYMNPAAHARYKKRGGKDLIGRNLMDCHNEDSRQKIEKVTAWFSESTDNNIVYTFHNAKENKDVYMIALRDEDGTLIGYYEKHEYRNPETEQLYQKICRE